MSDPAAAGQPTRDLSAKIAEAQKRIFRFVCARRWWHPTHPELLRAWGQVHKEIEDVRRLLERSGGDVPAQVKARLMELLKEMHPKEPANVDAPWAVAEELEILLPQIADEAYVGTLLEWESAHLDAQPEAGFPAVLWNDHLDPEELKKLQREYAKGDGVPEKVRERAVARLVFMYKQRSERNRRWRHRMATMRRYFWRSFLILAPLVLGLGAFSVVAGNLSTTGVILTGFAGAVGGSVAGIYKLRGLEEISGLRVFRAGMTIQPFLGAALALFILLLLESGILALPGAEVGERSWAARAAYGFVAGYSEPFFLGIVGHLAKGAAGSDEAPPEAGRRDSKSRESSSPGSSPCPP